MQDCPSNQFDMKAFAQFLDLVGLQLGVIVCNDNVRNPKLANDVLPNKCFDGVLGDGGVSTILLHINIL